MADVVISRAGAGTLFELEFFQKRSIIIPIYQASNHQVHNAYAISKRNPGLFTILDQTSIDLNIFTQIVNNHLFSNTMKQRQSYL